MTAPADDIHIFRSSCTFPVDAEAMRNFQTTLEGIRANPQLGKPSTEVGVDLIPFENGPGMCIARRRFEGVLP